ncbi:Putative general transcription factor TFIIH, subunit Tfb6 [Septoria linicola]|uniref:General transcription factor TFIIH, subunit Tfb6 n=1 Tax=Septoria linicola TaxID=215465 RepID=A0A9Q9AN03_9PEZI|nr:Putative general transcription factor TFIIH, subunit Tfb6 [Septoria linicola]
MSSLPGGFILSPPASSVASSNATARLPHPRNSPLRPGGSKEGAFIRYVDQQILHIQRRFAKRTSPQTNELSDIDRDKADTWGDVKGYASMKEACKDVEELLSVIWISGTPSLQVPYLISLALLVGNIIQAMPPTPKSLFRTLDKLDHAFASLLQGRDVDTGERLPGFAGERGVSGTEKVRIRSLVERTRVNVVEAFKKGEFEYEEPEIEELEDEDKMDTDTDGELVLENAENDGLDDDHENNDFNLKIARVYDATMVELGDSLEQPSIGIITEGRG